MDALLITFALYVLVGVKINKNSGWYNDYLSPVSTKQLQGIFAIVVVLHHLAQRTNGGLFFSKFGLVGHLAVSIFFFISGYGLTNQYIKRGGKYLEKFLQRRIPMLLIPYILTVIIYYIVFKFIGKETTLSSTLLSFVNGNPIVNFSWYVIAIIGFYLLFFISAYFSKKKYILLILIVGIGLCIYAIGCYFVGYGTWWYNSCFTFLIGIIWAVYENKIIRFVNKHFFITLGVDFILFLLFFIISQFPLTDGIIGSIINLVSYEASAILFCIFVILLSEKIQFRNRLLTYVGNISLEVYIIHGLIIELSRNSKWNIENDILFSISVLFGGFIWASLLHKVYQYVLKGYLKSIE